MKIRCINNDNIPQLQVGKLYSVKKLFVRCSSLMDPTLPYTYSNIRFETESGIPLPEFIENNYDTNRRTYIYKNSKVMTRVHLGDYLIVRKDLCFPNFNIKKGDVYKLVREHKSWKHLRSELYNNQISFKRSDVVRFFYRISEEEYNAYKRKFKLEKLKNNLIINNN